MLSNKKNLRSVIASCSEIYTKNVHTWAAINITWHYVSSYENVQNVNVLKNYFAVDFFNVLCQSKTQKNKNKKQISWGLSKHNTSFFERTEFGIYNTREVTAPNEGSNCLDVCGFWDQLHLQGEQKCLFAEWLHLNPLNGLFDIFQQDFVFWGLVLVLVCVHIC